VDAYDPCHPPDPEVWLATDEDERAALITAFHQRHKPDLASGARLHATLHVIVENQAAQGDTTPVERKLRQLMAQGLDRHEAIHCIASVLVSHIHRMAKRPDLHEPRGFSAAYYAALKRLNARKWLRSAPR
jgi:uncharacterized protein YoaH (UPF0181 family)